MPLKIDIYDKNKKLCKTISRDGGQNIWKKQ
jgi:hypothetical protein